MSQNAQIEGHVTYSAFKKTFKVFLTPTYTLCFVVKIIVHLMYLYKYRVMILGQTKTKTCGKPFFFLSLFVTIVT